VLVICFNVEVALGELVPRKGKKRKQTRRKPTIYDESPMNELRTPSLSYPVSATDPRPGNHPGVAPVNVRGPFTSIFVQRITGVETSDQLLGAYIFCVSSVRPTLVSLERLLPSLRTGRGPAFFFQLQAATSIKSASRDMDNGGELSQ
jgi:hypothetical protein